MELFGQSCSLKSGFIAYGMDAASFDVRIDGSMNIHTSSGLLTACRMMGKDLGGNGAIEVVCTGNATAQILSEIILPLAFWLGLVFGLEQPQSSLLPKWDSLQPAIEREKQNGLYWEIIIKFGAFGGMSWKPVLLQGTCGGLQVVNFVYELLLPKMKHRTFQQLTKQVGKWKTANGQYTEYSALYPPAFGETCAFAFKIHKNYWFVPPSDLWEYAGMEIKSFVDDLYVRIPSEEQVIATAKDRFKDNSPAVPTAIWSSRLGSCSAHCDLELAVEVRQCPLRSRAGEEREGEEKEKEEEGAGGQP
eukprot:s581_g23.t1